MLSGGETARTIKLKCLHLESFDGMIGTEVMLLFQSAERYVQHKDWGVSPRFEKPKLIEPAGGVCREKELRGSLCNLRASVVKVFLA